MSAKKIHISFQNCYLQFYKILPKSSFLLHWISASLYEMGVFKIISISAFKKYLENTFLKMSTGGGGSHMQKYPQIYFILLTPPLSQWLRQINDKQQIFQSG